MGTQDLRLPEFKKIKIELILIAVMERILLTPVTA